MNIKVNHDHGNKIVFLRLGRIFDIRSRKQFVNAFTSYDKENTFLLDFSAVETINLSSLGLLLLLSGYTQEIKSKNYVST
jgi:hypothetical protein